MADPLSITAGIIGVTTAAIQVSKVLADFVKRTKDAPRQATIVLREVGDIYTILTQLQPFVLSLETSQRPQNCLILADSVTAILTGCVSTTFWELEELIDQLKAQDPAHDFGLFDRVRWAAKESSIAAIMSRLQAHKLSMSVILNILNGSVAPLPYLSAVLTLCRMTMQGVMNSVHRLEMTVRNNHETMLGMLCTLQSQQISTCQTSSWMSLTDSQKTTQSLEVMNAAQESQVSCKSFMFEFEQDLVDTRYRRLNHNDSTSLLLTAEEQKTRRTMISALSNADLFPF
jgi:hypothetical protein